MALFRRFDPYAAIGEDNRDRVTLAGLAGLAGATAEIEVLAKAPAVANYAPRDKNQDRWGAPAKVANGAKPASASSWGKAEDECAAIVEPTTLLLADGRRLHRFQADAIPLPAPGDIAALLDQTRWHGAVLVADGVELIVVERRKSTLPAETLRAVKGCVGGIIAVLHGESRRRQRGKEAWPND